jgi:hypothetical protein
MESAHLLPKFSDKHRKLASGFQASPYRFPIKLLTRIHLDSQCALLWRILSFPSTGIAHLLKKFRLSPMEDGKIGTPFNAKV